VAVERLLRLQLRLPLEAAPLLRLLYLYLHQHPRLYQRPQQMQGLGHVAARAAEFRQHSSWRSRSWIRMPSYPL